MSGDAHNPINRRDFLRTGTAAVVAASLVGVRPAHAVGGPVADATQLRKAAAAALRELNQFAGKNAEEIERQKAIIERARDEALFILVASMVAAVATFGMGAAGASAGAGASGTASGGTARLNSLLAALAQWESETTKKNGPIRSDVRDAVAQVRQIVANTKDALVAREIFLRLSEDPAHAARVFEALRTGKRSVAEEMLKRDVAGSNVTLQTFNVATAVNMTVRINSFVYCLSTASQCSGKQVTFRR